MSIQINYHGIIVSTNTADEAASLIKKLSAPNSAQTPAATVPTPNAQSLPGGGRNLVAKENSDISRTVALLTAIQAGGGSVESDDIMAAVGAEHPRGLGAKLRPVKRVLEGLGYQPDDVFLWERTPDGPAWNEKPKLKEALRKLTG